MKAWMVAVACAAVALWGAVWLLVARDDAAQPAGATAAADAPAAAGSPAAHPMPGGDTSAVVAVTPPRVAPGAVAASPAAKRERRGAVTPSRDAYERARNLGAVFNALHAQSDPDALYFAERALRDCAQLLLPGDKAGEPVPIDRYRPIKDGDPVSARRKAAYDALSTRCAGFDLGDDPAATVRALREALLAADDPRATLAQLARTLRRGTDPSAAMAQVQALTASGDPYVLEQAASLMHALRGRYVFMFDGELVRPDVVAAAWSLASCDAGRDCGPGTVQAPCAFLAECDAIDFETSLARYQLAPSDFERMQLVRARIVQGFGANNWDPALFAPQPQPPWYRRSGP
jgi:hypothetical protein